jgi:pentacotripeptide repeat protein
MMATVQKHSNPLKDPKLSKRLSVLIVRYMTKHNLSDEQLVDRVNDAAGSGSISLATVRRYKEGGNFTPTPRAIGLLQDALGIEQAEIDLLFDPTGGASTGTPDFATLSAFWDELVADLKRKSQLPQQIEMEREKARVALQNDELDTAKSHLERQKELVGREYNIQLENIAYFSEEYAKSLASLGAFAFAIRDFANARENYGQAISLSHTTKERIERYRNSYLIASTACMALSGDEAKARAILKEMRDNDITPNVVSYNTLLTFVDSEQKARDILKEMRDNDITPNEISVTTAIKKADGFSSALEFVDDGLRHGEFVGRGAFQAAFSHPVAHLSAKELLVEYNKRPYKFESALEGPINQYRKTGQPEQAVELVLFAPHTGAAQRYYREEYDQVCVFFDAEVAAGSDEDNLHYAYGIAAHINTDWPMALKHLTIALDRAYAKPRIKHTKTLLASIPSAKP